MGNALLTLHLAFLRLFLKGGSNDARSGMPSLPRFGFQTFKEPVQSVCWWNLFNYVIFWWTFSYSLRLRIDIYWGSLLMENTRLSRHMMVSFWGLLFLDHGKESRNLGHHPSVASLCGWSRTTCVGRLIASHIVDCLILSTILFVTKKRSLLTISLWIVCLQENSGSFYSDKSVSKTCPPNLQIYPSMLGGKMLAASPRTDWRGKELIHLSFLELGLFGTIIIAVFFMERPWTLLKHSSWQARNAAYGLWLGLEGFPSWLPSSMVVRMSSSVVVVLCNGVTGANLILESVCVVVCVGVCGVVWALALFSLLNIMKRNSRAFSRKKKRELLCYRFLTFCLG